MIDEMNSNQHDSKKKLSKQNPSPKPAPKQKPSNPQAVIVFLGVGFILTSLSQMSALMDYNHYRYLFQQYTETAIHARFVTSWIARFLGISIGIGFLCRKEIFRKAGIILATGTIAMAYWKHPYAGFIQHIHWLNDYLPSVGMPLTPKFVIELAQETVFPGFTEEIFTSLSVISIIVWEIFCSGFVLYFLTRPPVKSQFH